jgi:hypothetical protein
MSVASRRPQLASQAPRSHLTTCTSPQVDDVVALCMAHGLVDNGEAELLAVVQDTAPPQCAGVISAIKCAPLPISRSTPSPVITRSA